MKIKSVRIKNFRALKDVQIDFDAVTTFIGPNGAGKSTVLRALDWFFNGKPNALTDKDCSFGNIAEPIEVQVTFTDLTAKDRAALGKYAPEDASKFTAWKQRFPSGIEMISANAKGFPLFNEIKSASTANAKKELYSRLRAERLDLELPTASTGAAVDQALVTWESSHTDQLVDAAEALQTNFFGFNSGGKMSGLFDFVLVTADLRASEESTDTKSSIVGRILERSIDRAAADEEIAKLVEESRTKQQEIYEQKFKGQLASVTESLNRVVGSYASGRSIMVVPTEVELKAPRTTFNVAVLDGDTETAVERQGHGFQRTLLISALQLLAQSSAAETDSVICLAIEEPELYQHPIQAQAFAKVLRSLAEDSDKRMQVTYATHSPYFIEARYFSQVRRITRSTDTTHSIAVHRATIDAVKERLASIREPDVVDRQLAGIVEQLSIALFSDRVFLVEGTTEVSVFQGIADRNSIGELEAAGIAIVAAGSKTSITLVHAILKSIGIPVYVLFDADAGCEARSVHQGKSTKKIQDEKANNVKENRLALKYFGLPEEDFPSERVTEHVAIFEDQLESFLDEKWPSWKDSCQKIEEEAGVRLAKNQAAYRLATLNAEGEVPRMLKEILGRVMGKQALDELVEVVSDQSEMTENDGTSADARLMAVE